MGFIEKDTLAVDAVLTNKGRDYLRKAVFGENQNGEHVITKFALADDEIDYSLWDMTVSGSNFEKPFGQVIDNQPLTEPNVNWKSPTDSEIMRYFLFKTSFLNFLTPSFITFFKFTNFLTNRMLTLFKPSTSSVTRTCPSQ